jgi:phosphoglycolate phosphatase
MKIAIFDMDGTLLNSAKDITLSVNEVRRKNHGLHPLEENFVIEAINRDKRNLAKLFYDTELYEKKDKLYFEEHYAHQCTQNVYLYEGIKETFEALRANYIRISVATNAPTPFARLMLEKCGVFELFDFVVGADRVAKAKPDREMLVKILKGYGYLRGNQALMVGDNSKDMQAAAHAGIDSAFATWGFSPDTSHSTIFSHPKEILTYFKG